MSTLSPDRAAPESDDEALDRSADAAGRRTALLGTAAGKVSRRLCSGANSAATSFFLIPRCPTSQKETVENAVASVKCLCRHTHRPRGDRPRGRYSALGDRGPGQARACWG